MGTVSSFVIETHLSGKCKKLPLSGEQALTERVKKKDRHTFSWVFVKQFSRNDMATACQDWLRVPG